MKSALFGRFCLGLLHIVFLPSIWFRESLNDLENELVIKFTQIDGINECYVCNYDKRK